MRRAERDGTSPINDLLIKTGPAEKSNACHIDVVVRVFLGLHVGHPIGTSTGCPMTCIMPGDAPMMPTRGMSHRRRFLP